jgi:hypothetical protein
MSEPSWTLLPSLPMQAGPVVWREWPDGKQESRLASSFTPDDPNYANIMALVAAGELTIAPAEDPAP